VQWHHRTAQPVSAVVSHPRDQYLAVFSSQAPSSTVSIFDPCASSPRNTYTLPFTLRGLVWYPQSPSKANETSTFHLVGITDNWDVVLCGDDVHLLVGQGLGARGLVVGSQEPRKRTLLQDIFGDSALAGAPVGPPIPNNVTSALPWKGKGTADILSGPAYLIPPLETLFEPIMTNFLIPRPPEEDTTPVPGLPEGEEKDDSMDVDESAGNPLASAVRAERVVDAREMDALIELFRHHGVKAPSPLPHVPLSNGHVPEVQNNAYNKKVNGHSHTPKAKVNSELHPKTETPNGRSSPESPSKTVTTSSPVVTGKKRKKIAVP